MIKMAFMLLTHLTLIKVSISNPKLFWLEQWKLSQLLHPDIKPVPFLSLASEWGTLLGPSRLWCFYRLTSIVVHSSRGFLNGGSSSKHTSVKRKGWNFCTFTRVTWLFWSEKNHRYPPYFTVTSVACLVSAMAGENYLFPNCHSSVLTIDILLSV